MPPAIAHRAPAYCWRSLFADLSRRQTQKRKLVTIQRGRPEKLDPSNIPRQFWPQLPSRLRPDRINREIIIHKPPPSEYEACKDPIKIVDNRSLASLDPSGARSKLFDRDNADRAKPGDILLTTFKTGEPFSGILMAVKGQGPHKSILLRNHLTRIGTEMVIKIHSPLVQSMEVAQRGTKRRKRARLYFLRKPAHDVGSVQKVVDQYVRERALLSGRKSRFTSAASKQTSRRK